MSLPSCELNARKGHTEARLFTPPLRDLTPETSWGFACIQFLQRVLGWDLMPWQKWLYIHALEKSRDGIGYRYQTIVVLIARQNGKTQWLKGLGLWRLYIDGAKQVLISAQNLEFAETTLAEAVADVKSNAVLRREFRRFSQTNGKFRMVLLPTKDAPTEPREWRAAVSNRKGPRSLSVDLALLDEVREHQNWLAWNAIVPTTTARPRSLVCAASNAGDATSVVLRSLRDGALQRIATHNTEDTTTGIFEWSVPDDKDPNDPEFWPLANPAQGYLFSEATLYGRLEAMSNNIAGWRTEHQCQWVEALEPGIIPAPDWASTTDAVSKRADDAAVWASLDVNFQRTKSYVCIAARRTDGLLHWEVIAAERGTEWVIPYLSERANRFEGVVIQARGAPASGLIEPLLEAGVPVIELGGTDLTKCYGYGYDLITEQKMRHRPSPTLDAAAGAAKAKMLSDAWVIDRKNSPVDVSPLVGCFQAAWAESVGLQPVPVSAYESGGLLIV